MRYTLFIFMMICFMGSFAQTTDDSQQVKQNQVKIEELKSRLKGVSEEIETEEIDNSEVYGKLLDIEKQLTNLLLEFSNWKKEQSVATARIEKQLNEVQVKSQSFTSFSSDSVGKKNVNRSGSFYVVIESQKTLEQAQKAKNTHYKRGRNVTVFRSNKHNWYYLVYLSKSDYKTALNRVNTQRDVGIKTAWWVNEVDVSIVE